MFKDNGYNSSKYKHFRIVGTGETFISEVKSKSGVGNRKREVTNRVEIPYTNIEDINLDSIGEHIPQNETDFFLVSNYLLDFWGSVLGSEVVYTYLMLRRYAYGRKDFCFPDVDTICIKMKKTRPTINKYLSILEEHGFILVFYRYDKDSRQDSSPLFKIRRYIPVITEEMYESLPDKLKTAHDELLNEVNGVRLVSQIQKVDIDDITKDGTLIKTKRKHQVEANVINLTEEDIAYEKVASQLDERDLEVSNIILRYAQSHEIVSKPSFDTFFKRCLFIINKNRIMIVSPSVVESSQVALRYSRVIENGLAEEGYNIDSLSIESYDAIGFVNQYMSDKVRES